MSTEMIDGTGPACYTKNLQAQSALKGGNIVGFSALISVGLLVFSARSALASRQLTPLPLLPVTAQPQPLLNPSVVMANKRSLPTALVSQAVSGGSLEVSNGTNLDAYVKLVEPASDILVGSLYVKANATLTLNQVPDGIYQVLFVLGEGWNADTQSFAQNKSFARFDESLNFTTTPLSNGIEYSVFRLTLHPVANGNARTSGLDEQEFNRY
jgi:hypothetical protein